MEINRTSINENLGKILFAVGITFLFLGFMLLTVIGSPASVFSFMIGIELTLIGILSTLGLFSQMRSLSGAGMIMICTGIGLVVFAICMFQYIAIVGVDVQRSIWKGIVSYIEVPKEVKPYLWLSQISIWLGIGTFIAGIAARIVSIWK